jgi:hypothetical protein
MTSDNDLRLSGLGLFEFHRADGAIALGAEATEKALERLGEAGPGPRLKRIR